MKVVGFRRREERQVIAGMGVQGWKNCQREPQISRRHVGADDENAEKRWNEIREYVLERIAVNSCNSYRRRPLMMLFVNVLVEVTAVQHSVKWSS